MYGIFTYSWTFKFLTAPTLQNADTGRVNLNGAIKPIMVSEIVVELQWIASFSKLAVLSKTIKFNTDGTTAQLKNAIYMFSNLYVLLILLSKLQ